MNVMFHQITLPYSSGSSLSTQYVFNQVLANMRITSVEIWKLISFDIYALK